MSERSVGVSKENEWRGRLKRWEASTLTVAAFCRGEGVSVPTLYEWRKRLAVGTSGTAVAQRGDAKVAFVPVRVSPSSATVPIEVELPNGSRVRLSSGDHELLRSVIEIAGRLPVQEGKPC